MQKQYLQKGIWLLVFATGLIMSLSSFATQKTTSQGVIKPMVINQLLEKAKANNSWKVAAATAKHAQIVFMSVSPETNPKNEIGMETHPFDQVILVVEGHGKTVLNGKTSTVNAGDMIFIPQGTEHNVINSDPNKALKIVSFYSSNDIPANSEFKKKSDEPHE